MTYVSTRPHEVQRVRGDNNRHYWACSCGWRTEPSLYSDIHAGPQAILHMVRGNRDPQAYPAGNADPAQPASQEAP